MNVEYWTKQQPGEPSFPDMSWSRPERRDQAGKLLIVGGNAHGFAAPAEAYTHSTSAGIGTTRVLLPNKLQKTVSQIFPEAEYGTSTPSGSFAKDSLGEWLDLAAWSDCVLLAGNFGQNSETIVLLEAFLRAYAGPVTIVGDSIQCFLTTTSTSFDRPRTTLVVTMPELQKLMTHARSTTAITQSMDLMRLVQALHEFTSAHSTFIITQHDNTHVIAVNGQVSTTKQTAKSSQQSLVGTAAHASVWWLQHLDKPFKAFTTSLVT